MEVRAKIGQHDRCPRCFTRAPLYDHGRPRAIRALDAGLVRVYVHDRPVRVSCPAHGVVTAVVPWARSGARHTYAFEKMAAWAVTQMSTTAVTALLRCSWPTVGALAERVHADLRAGAARAAAAGVPVAGGADGLGGLARIGIDEVSYRKGHRYALVVVDHDSGALVWSTDGRGTAAVTAFFDALGVERTKALTHVTSDSAHWITSTVARYAPHVVHAADPFHVMTWAGSAVDTRRRTVWNQVRRTPAEGGGRNKPAVGDGKTINTATWALRKKIENWTDAQRGAFDWVAANHPSLIRAWQLKESLRAVFTTARARTPTAATHALTLLDLWIADAHAAGAGHDQPGGQSIHEPLPEFTALALRIERHRTAITACIVHGLSNALTESTNTKIRLLTRRAYGFANVHNMLALAHLCLGRHTPTRPT